ncbi:hypothetical protein [Comamonas sp. GB3 AK4-5]|uniref:hypothetical protein n=1 Tax=Comamonas sp. GB3 AK4-5 TaxID=3231487 RepID=UPI00351E510E
MSIFDRLKSNLPGSEAAAAAPAAESKVGGGRFMGKDESQAMRRAERAVQEKPVEQGLQAPGEVWIYVCPNTQRVIKVEALGQAQGEVLTARMMADLQRTGICEEVSYHAGYDQYWKMPSQEAIFRMPTLHGVEVPPLKRLKLSTKLVKPGEARGFWMRVRLRTDAELPQAASADDSRVG